MRSTVVAMLTYDSGPNEKSTFLSVMSGVRNMRMWVSFFSDPIDFSSMLAKSFSFKVKSLLQTS